MSAIEDADAASAAARALPVPPLEGLPPVTFIDAVKFTSEATFLDALVDKSVEVALLDHGSASGMVLNTSTALVLVLGSGHVSVHVPTDAIEAVLVGEADEVGVPEQPTVSD